MINEFLFNNYKSLKNVSVQLRPLTFFCGPNASGKTNFVDAIDFLSQVFRGGLPYAVAEKGGFYNMCFRRMRRTKGSIGFTVRGSVSAQRGFRLHYDLHFSLSTYTEKIQSDFLVESEHYLFKFVHEETNASFSFHVARDEGRYLATGTNPVPGVFDKLFQFSTLEELNADLKSAFKPDEQELLFGPTPRFTWEFVTGSRRVARELEGLRVFQINPRTARQPGTPSVSGGMGRHGENLPIAIATFLSKKRLSSRLNSWVQDVIPAISQLQTKYTVTKQTGLFLQEKGIGAPWYAEDLSDGTIMSLALFMCLLEPTHRTVVIEEPENSLHPWILQKLIDRCREVSEERQVLITTHSPLVVAAASPEELMLIEKREGHTEIIPAIRRDWNIADIIRKNVLDLGEYWLSGGLGAVPEAAEPAESNGKDTE